MEVCKPDFNYRVEAHGLIEPMRDAISADALVRLLSLFEQRDRELADFLGCWTEAVELVTLTQGVAVTVDMATSFFDIRTLGASVRMLGRLVASSGGTAGSVIVVAWPDDWTAYRLATHDMGTFTVKQTGVLHDVGVAVPSTGAGTNVEGVRDGAGSAIGADPNFALAAADEVWVNLDFRLAP